MSSDDKRREESPVLEALRGKYGDEQYGHLLEDAKVAMGGLVLEDLDPVEEAWGERGTVVAALELGRYPRASSLDPEEKVDALDALAQLEVRKGDSEFQTRLRRGEPNATDEWRELHEMAYPPGLNRPVEGDSGGSSFSAVDKERALREIEALKKNEDYIKGTAFGTSRATREPWTKKMGDLMKIAYEG